MESEIFWTVENEKIKISQSKLIFFLERKGFRKIRLSETSDLLVKVKDNVISKSSISEITQEVRIYLCSRRKFEIFEHFAKGNYVSNSKLNLMKIEEIKSDRDEYDVSRFFFNDCFYEVSKKGVNQKKYSELDFPIWDSRIINQTLDFENLKDKEGQFEKFCKILSKDEDNRFKSLKSILGFLLHRNRERGETFSIIFYDENMSLNSLANGGTGKTLLCRALSYCRDTVMFDGKEIKNGSWFKNQRIQLSTDILAYDDLGKEVSLEAFFASLTSGIEVEKKRQQSFMIPYESMPKIIFTSNYYIKGPGGSSDLRRRLEFEVANFFDNKNTPEGYFGNRFFGRDWDDKEWARFYLFMMSCVEVYLENGVIQPEPLNLTKSKVSTETCTDFVEFVDGFFETNTWYDKREAQSDYEELFDESVSAHQFKKWLSSYADGNEMDLEIKNSNNKYQFILKSQSDNANI